MARTEYLIRDVGHTRITLRSQTLPKPANDPGYDFTFDTVYVVEVRDEFSNYPWGEESTYGDYGSALQRYEREVAWAATRIAKRAMRIPA